MTLEKKITKAVLSAMKHLENSRKSIKENNENVLTNQVWKASAEVEYTLFLFSILQQNEHQSHSWKVDLKSKQLEVAPAITSTQELLKKAKISFENGDLLEAHKKIWIARGYLLKIQKVLEKKRK
jgi:hypothetical protein